MKVKIWGARGSIPTPLTSSAIREKIIAALHQAEGIDLKDPMAVRNFVDGLPPLVQGTAGGNTSCIEIQTGNELIIIDAGSGIRELGDKLMKGPCGKGQAVVHLFLSHTHWDHIQGLPFFVPAYIRGNVIKIYSIHDVAPTLADQMKPATFPVSLDYMQATFEFISLTESENISIGDIHVSNMALPHPGVAYAFRFEHQGSIFVYASDAEYKHLDEANLQPYLRFFAGANVLIFDAQFTLREAFVKEDWGHSSALIGADMALRAGVQRMVLFHHDPTSRDEDLASMQAQTIDYINEQADDLSLEVLVAREGLEFDLSPANATSLQILPGKQIAILRLVGDLDERAVIELQDRIGELLTDVKNERPSLIVDLEATTRLSIAGLRALIDLRRQWETDTLVLASPSAHVQRVIELADYYDFFAVYPSLQLALAALEARHTLKLPGQLLRQRYRIEYLLAESEKGSVLRAIDTRLGRPVAIKVLSSSFSQAAMDRFRGEAQRMARLNAPNIASVFDCNEEQGLVYLVLEYVSGKTLRQLMAQSDTFPALDIALEILRALEYAHSKGVIHGNLKPENVLIADTVKLTDFGLRWIEQGRRLTEAPILMGSPDYLAPEQILGQPMEPRTDLYAFGVILYELFTGKRPFAGETSGQILDQHLHQNPLPPRQLKPDISRSLEHLILKLLAKDPGQRYTTATQVRRILLSLQRATSTALPPAETNWMQGARKRRARFFGRDNQLQRLLSLWNLARDGQGQLVLIAGEAGIGKTRLAEEVAARLDGAIVLFGRCSESEGNTPYQPFIEAGRDYLAHTALSELRPQLADSASVVAELIPEIHDLIPNLPPLAPLTAEHERLRLMHGLTQFIGRATAVRPWFLLLDDLHWADPASLQALHYLARNITTAPMLIIGTYRDVELEADHPLHEIRQSLSRYPSCHHMTLNRLDQQGVNQLLAEMWGRQVPKDWTETIYQRTGGNPFYVEEVAKDLEDEGAVTMRDGVWHFAPLRQVKLPKKIHDVILRRVARLNPTAQDILRLAAVLGQHLSFEALLAVAELSEEMLLENLDELLERDLIHEEDGGTTLAFSHDEIQEIVYADLNPLRQRVLHRRVGRALENSYAGDRAAIAGQLAHHFILAGDKERGFQYSLLAAQQARTLHAYQMAFTWYDEAARQMKAEVANTSTGVELYEGLGIMLRLQARYDEAMEAFRAMQNAAAAAGDTAAQARAWNRLSDVYDSRGENREALESAERAEALARVADAPMELVTALYNKGWAASRLGDTETALAQGEQALAVSAELDETARREMMALSLNLLSVIHKILGRYEDANHYQTQALALYQELGNRGRVATMLNNLGENAAAWGDYSTALSYFQQALEHHRDIGNKLEELLAFSNIGVAQVGLGHYAQAETNLRQVLQTMEETGWFLAATYSALALACLAQDKVTAALEAVQQALALAQETEEQEYLGIAWRSLGHVVAHADIENILNQEQTTALPPLQSEQYDPAYCFSESLRIFHEIGAEGEEARTLLAWARYELDQGAQDKGQKMQADAREIFERLAMEHEIKRMVAAEGSRE